MNVKQKNKSKIVEISEKKEVKIFIKNLLKLIKSSCNKKRNMEKLLSNLTLSNEDASKIEDMIAVYFAKKNWDEIVKKNKKQRIKDNMHLSTKIINSHVDLDVEKLNFFKKASENPKYADKVEKVLMKMNEEGIVKENKSKKQKR